MNMPATDPSELRPLLHQQIDQCPAADLPLLHRVMLDLERDRLLIEMNTEFDVDRDAGRLESVPEMIKQARAALARRSSDSRGPQ